VRQELERIIELQPHWSQENNAPMVERGALIRQEGPAWLRTFAPELASAIGTSIDDVFTEGRDGTGRKTEIPWFRFSSKFRSPSATMDWYCVYLFDTNGDGVYLSLGHGSTTWTGMDFRPRPHEELRQRADWARGVLSTEINQLTDLSPDISLHSRRSALGPAYEAATVVTKFYERGNVPDDDFLKEDALTFARLLRAVYDGSDKEWIPGDPAPEVVEALETAEKTAGNPPARPRGGGFRLNTSQKTAIEIRAMEVALAHLEDQGYTNIKNTSKGTFDYQCNGPGGDFYVEVKGTTTTGENVILTRNEVRLHRQKWPANALIVVSEIQLVGENRDTAIGGSPTMTTPWDIDDDDLTVISYQYRTPPG
jgi:hypothetical protein